MTPTNGHAVNGHPANGHLSGHASGQPANGQDQGQTQYQAEYPAEYQAEYQVQYGGYPEVASYPAADPAGDPYRDYRRPDPGTNGYGVSPAEGPATSGYGIARPTQGPPTGSYAVARANDGYGQGYGTGSFPTAQYQPVGYGRQPGAEVARSGYPADPDATQLFRATPQRRRDWDPEPELDLGESGNAVPPPPLRSTTQVQPAVREQAGWSAIGAPALPGSTPPPRPKGPRLRVDWPNCKAHGLCHELLPEAVRLDEWGFPIVGNHPLPSHILDDARRAVIACPTLALRLVD